MADVLDVAGRRLLLVADDGPTLRDAQGAMDLIAEGMAADARVIVLPVGGIDPSFFELRSGFAGGVLQELANYRIELAVLGDISAYIEASAAFRDFVRETERGDALFFCAAIGALSDRLIVASDSTVR